LTTKDNIGVPTFVTIFYILHYACLNGIHFCLQQCGVEANTDAISLFQPLSYTLEPVPSLPWDPSAYQTGVIYVLG
jgi:hypothetical protein